MSSSFEKSVKGATKIKLAPPKSKYIEHILIATHSGEHGVAEVFRALQNRLRDSTWTVVFKGLITVHLMIREGSPDVTLEFLSNHKNMLATSSFTDVQTHGKNIRHYSSYLTERARGYRHSKCDFVRGAENRFQKLTVDKGLLRETELVQLQISSLLKCDVLDNEPENEITITVFRMLVLDLLALYHVINQAMIAILGQFFEMTKTDAQRALEIYRRFTKHTDLVVAYLGTARTYEHKTRVEVPKLKHAPVNLGKQLEDYLADPDFDINRRQYLAEEEAKKKKNGTFKPFLTAQKTGGSSSRVDASKTFPDAKPSKETAATTTKAQPAPPKGPAPDLIDFFASIELKQEPLETTPPQQPVNAPNFTGAPQFQGQQQQPMQQQAIHQQQAFQQNGFVQQQTGFQDPNQQQQHQFNNGFTQPQPMQQPQQLQPNMTGAGFGGYTQQPQAYPSNYLSPTSQNTLSPFPGQPQQPFQTGPQQQVTNPFRASMMMNHAASASPTTMGQTTSHTLSPVSPQNTNPFAKPASAPPGGPQAQQYQPTGPAASPLQPAPTGTNPFARRPGTSGAGTPGGLAPQPTGTNPFRQSAFVNTATGMGWQNNQAPIGGGLDSMPTIEVFPRPAQQQPWSQ
ncbi:hypothetical protein VC83_03649 [Pseudogymnoascus destructans]|uniref:ENTH domain-containing protein n=2 Tax=Pseudogymnoascus destructans TaxID=655981 RepID=L8FWI7_PSED2|nr:uncharacterized protein VC83_03649 [Pseudogymnoascus destructans]ELR04848.1 hypothetical protein GMDG_07073 [Pseudogymnoascus destructans 20631-21]OAF60481.1 hypothetical protein VC83_03649 [Pseudogymnoascus destructans]